MSLRDNLRDAQSTLWGLSVIEVNYWRWRATPAGKTVYQEAESRARRLFGIGIQHYGIGAIAESIRYDRLVRIKVDELGFRLNNNHRALLAREIMANNLELAGFFETRQIA